MAKVLVALCVLAALVAGVYFAIFSTSSASRGTPAVAPAPPPPSPEVAEDDGEERSPALVVPEAIPDSNAPAPVEGGLQDGDSAAADEYAAKYAGKSPGQLALALEQLDRELAADRTRSFERCFASGDFERLEEDPDDRRSLGERVRDLAPPRDADRPELLYQLRHDPDDPDPRGQRMLVAFLPSDAYPALYARMHERAWLAARVGVQDEKDP